MGTIRITATDNMGFSVGMIHLRVHEPDQCVGEVCVIHHPSQHSLSGAPMHWRSDRRIIERICQHGCGHPDPDNKTIRSGEDGGIHNCDGCCSPPGNVKVTARR